MAENSHWTLDRRVPLALIAAVVFQSMCAVWWASTITAQLGTTTARVEILERMAVANQALSLSVARLEEKMQNIQDTIKEIRQNQPNIHPPGK